jgi:glycosyltransferase involved in cell wall biosynthesis
MRIALFTETFLPKVDGIVTRLIHTVTFLQKLGHQVLVVAPEGGLTEYNGAEVFGVSGLPLPMYPELKLALPRPAIGNALEAFKPDLIHIVNPAVLGMAGLFYAKLWKIPLVASYHTHLPHYLKYYGFSLFEGVMWELIKLTHNQAQLNLCTSNAMVQELGEHGVERLALWQRGVDIDQFNPQFQSDEMRSRLTQGHPQSPLLLYVGRLSPEKEIEAIKPILESIPNARLALVGDGPHRESLEQYFAHTPTFFAGYMSGETLSSAFASADAFMFPSKTETLGLVLLEAMAAGCPVVAAGTGGITDIVDDGINGYLFNPNDPHGAIAATQRLLSNDIERERVRTEARAEAECWGWQAATQQLETYYQNILKGATTRPISAEF